jgi:hypothetical protein
MDIGNWAMEYEMNRNSGRSFPGGRQPKQNPNVAGGVDPGRDQRKENRNGSSGGELKNHEARKGLSDKEKDRLKRSGLCFFCKEGRHMSRECPKKISGAGVLQTGNNSDDESWILNLHTLCEDCEQKEFTRNSKVKVNNKKVWAMRDTGCDDICISVDLIEERQKTGRTKTVKYAKSDLHEQCDIVEVELDTPYFNGKTEAIVIQNPLSPILIGNRYGSGTKKNKTPVFPVREPEWYDKKDISEISQVETRSSKETKADGKRNLTPTGEVKFGPINITPKDLKNQQKEDPTLQKFREAAESGEVKNGGKMVWRDEILYQSSLNRHGDEILKVVVPKDLRTNVMNFAHDHALAGHLCTKKTTEKIRREFWWPGCANDIKRYCLSCDVCQRSAPKPQRFPLGRMPIFVTPFQQVAVDLIGPIEPMSEGKNRFILVMVDYATRYPEAVALKNTRSETIADALFTLWSRLGIPEQILSDNASNLNGKLMNEVLEMLRIKHRVTSVYNPRGNGACERANGHIKQMIRKMCSEQPKTWDKVLDALLFAYREAPHESTGFSPFELLFGRTVRGPMQLLRQLWTDESVTEEVKLTTEYVVNLREKLEGTCEIARENLKKSAKKQAKWYNKKTRSRFLKCGEQVLVLIPRKKNTLQLAWQGPYKVIEVINKFDYRIEMGNKNRIFHINLLKKYMERNADVTSLKTGDEDVGSEDVPSHVAVVIEESEVEDTAEMFTERQQNLPTLQTHQTESTNNVNYSTTLSQEQKLEAQEIVEQNRRICTDVPLTTNLLDIGITITEKNPVFVKQRPIPHAMVKSYEQEIDDMLKLGVIEPANSPYNANIVMVKKKNGDYRFCQDLRQLNDVVVFDGEPLTDVEHLFFKIGKAKYFSKIDLCKGYWGIQIREEDRDKTAFATPRGQFRWVNMPFGLKTAAGAFNRMMRKLLGPLNKEWIHHFMDDILIATETWEEHVQALKQVLDRLNEANLAAKPSKMYIGFDELPYLGHMVGNGKRWPESEKVEKILNTPKPKTKKEIKSLLGQASFYREYIQSYSSVIAPLTDLTRKGFPEIVIWTPEAVSSFEKLRKLLSEEPVLKIPDDTKSYVLRTDASSRGLGAVLLQEFEGKLHPVAYQSRKLLGAETRYATVEKECLATVWAIKKI